jgi:hypothetical protein
MPTYLYWFGFDSTGCHPGKRILEWIRALSGVLIYDKVHSYQPMSMLIERSGAVQT